MSPGAKPEENKNTKPSDGDRSSITYWQRWIKAAKKAAKDHWDDSQGAYNEYELPSAEQADKSKPKRGYHIYAESCWTLEPGYYAKGPIIVGRRRFGIEDEMALTMSMIAERLGQHLVDHGNFDNGMEAAASDLMHACKASTQVVYTRKTRTVRLPLTAGAAEGEYFVSDPVTQGQTLYDGEPLQDEGGIYGEREELEEDTQRIFIAPLLFDRVLHTPEAVTPAEITEMAYWFCIDEEEAELQFNTGPDGKKLGKNLPYRGVSDVQDDEKDEAEKRSPGRKLEGWECYCLKTKKVYWVSCEYTDDFLCEPKEDPYGLKKFFPSPDFIIKNKRRKSLYPTPSWVYLEATANQLHLLYERIFILIDAIRPRAIVYGASVDTINALNSVSTGMYVSIKEIDDILSKGGLSKMIEWFPVQELVSAISEALILEEKFTERFSLAFGIPDILKGISDPRETAEAQGIKSDAGNNRFKKDKKKLNDLGRDTAEMMLDLALKVFSTEKIKRICGWEFMERGTPEVPSGPPNEQNPQGTPGQPATLSHYERFDDALARLRNDEDRIVTIDFETDSTSFQDETRAMQRAQMIQQLVIQGLSTIGGMENMEFMPTILDSFLVALDSIPGGSTKSENMIKRAVSELEKKRKEPPPPPPPDAALLKVQLGTQELELKKQIAAADKAREDFMAKLEEMKLGNESQVERIRVSLEEQIEGMKIALANKSAEIENQKRVDKQQDSMLKAQLSAKDLELQGIKNERDSQLSAMKLENERKMNEMYVMLDQQRVDNDRLRVQQEEVLSKLRIVESFMEEKRLSKESNIHGAAALIDSVSAATQEPASTE